MIGIFRSFGIFNDDAKLAKVSAPAFSSLGTCTILKESKYSARALTISRYLINFSPLTR